MGGGFQEETEELFEWQGEMHTVVELAEIVGITKQAMDKRLDTCKSMDEAMSPVDGRRAGPVRRYEWGGKRYTRGQLARIRGVSRSTMRKWLEMFPADEAMRQELGHAGKYPSLHELDGKMYTAAELAGMKGITVPSMRRLLRKYHSARRALMARQKCGAPE